MKRTQYIVVQGNPVDGYSFIGPMPQQGAQILADHLLYQEDVHIAPLQEPQAIPAPVVDEELPW